MFKSIQPPPTRGLANYYLEIRNGEPVGVESEEEAEEAEETVEEKAEEPVKQEAEEPTDKPRDRLDSVWKGGDPRRGSGTGGAVNT